MGYVKGFGFLLFWFLLGSACVMGQEKQDSSRLLRPNGRVSRELMEAITKNPTPDTIFNLKSEDAFLPYQGKIIRKILIGQIGFERSFYEGEKKFRNKIIQFGNALHTTSQQQVIRENLFIRENRPLNPYKVADNERYLRDLNFLLDARIDVITVEGSDSVDLVIFTRDVFSLGGRFSPRSATAYRFGIYDVNLFGWGQRVEFNGIYDNNRSPVFGEEFIYEKISIGGSLADVSVGYTSLNTGSSYGIENEGALFLKINRPLVSPYTRLAGGLEWSDNWSTNVRAKPDSLFLRYKYSIYDVWMGYNIGLNNTARNRNRHFVALRWFHQDFDEQPSQERFIADPLYNNNSFVLSEVTFFRQDFYKTRFIYGFGRTEDVPYGQSASLVIGWANQLNLRRTYASAGATKKIVSRQGDFFEANIRGATYINQDRDMEDATILFSLSWFSRLLPVNNFRIRQYLKVSYAVELNHRINPLLDIGNEFGVRGFRTDSLRGVRRLGFTMETVAFAPWKLMGFRFAPLAFADIAFLPPPGRHIFYDKPYLGAGAGIRTRNENLIFGTIEFKFTYYPRTVENITQFRVGVSSNLRVKFSDSFVRPPSFLRFN